MHRVRRAAIGALVLLAAPFVLRAQTSADDRAARAIFAELVGINTTHDHGSTTLAARAVRRRLLARGQVLAVPGICRAVGRG